MKKLSTKQVIDTARQLLTKKPESLYANKLFVASEL
jgi:hypothetical protein